MKRPDDNALAQAGQLPSTPFTGTAQMGTGESPADDEGGFSPLSPQSPHPLALPESALHGLAGDFVNLVAPHTEASEAALLGQLLVAFGSIVGRGPHFLTEADEQHTNEYLGLVGDTSKGRKGTSWSHVKRLLVQVDPDWVGERLQHGLSTGEGLIWTVRDEVVDKEPVKKRGLITHYQDVIKAHAVTDKRVLFQEGELAGALKLIGREGNTLSAVLRCAWDTGDLRSTTKTSPGRATGAHVSVIGHITALELLARLSEIEAGNGFANRFLWLWTYRSRILPDGGCVPPEEFAALAALMRPVVTAARAARRLEWSAAARQRWHAVYPSLAADRPGLLGKVTARAEPHVVRLALLYALLDAATCVDLPHLEAALGLWQYSLASARRVFGLNVGHKLADRILAIVEARPEGLTRTELRMALANNKISAEEIDFAVGLLGRHHLVELVQTPSAGRAATRLVPTDMGMGRLGILGREGGGGAAPRTGGGVTSPRVIPGWSADERVCAWLRAFLRGMRTGDTRLVVLAQAELRRLGVEVRAVPGSTR